MPRYGFNFQWMYVWQPGAQPQPPDERALDWLARFGFDFVRLPTDYRFWTRDFNYFQPDEAVLIWLDRYLEACRARGLHLSLNLHRAPGYCINRNDLERHNLWTDQLAQDAFVFLWELLARRYRGVPGDVLSFDLLNEPPNVGQYGLTRAGHAALIRRTVAAIRAIDAQRPIVIDGLGGGHLAMPELADLGVIHSGRGYQPMPVSHHGATWWSDHATAPAPVYPGVRWEGRVWDRATLRAFYEPWRAVEAAGAAVHIGECGCYNQTPNAVALRWLGDLFGVLREFGWGYALWNFVGPFGIIEHGRPGARYETLHGYRVDRELLDLMLEHRVAT
ncbi:glycoside hydrolase family 5 protein [Kallotenue papyrolyticum]|uniref:glycoside hydrolase family 5 protein n=1 Tax=Kallotenue papyrolyticum TaxID=1325125 RepID=UPI000478617F|nr:cellulase family glycosylhydrolase [Kallotenue papyrolyticum]